MTYSPDPPLQPSLDDGSFQPGATYQLHIAGNPRPDGVRSADGARLGSSMLVVHGLERVPGPPDAAGTRIAMQWELRGDAADGTRGTDTFTVVGDRITDQQVVLHTADY